MSVALQEGQLYSCDDRLTSISGLTGFPRFLTVAPRRGFRHLLGTYFYVKLGTEDEMVL
jgi:hypothetical protein